MPQLMKHQKEAVEKLGNGKILWGGVGAGKSMTVMAYYMAKESKQNIVVITTAKKRDSLDWEGEAIRFGISTKPEFTKPGYGTIKVDSWNNISKYVGTEDAFFIFDEQRVVGSGVWTKSFIKVARANRWVLLSATPGDTWMDYIPVFCANNLYRNRTEFIREHCVFATHSKYPKVIKYTGVRQLEKYRNMLLVEMPFTRHTVRHIEKVICDYDVDRMRRVTVDRWNIFEERPLRDAAEMFACMRKVDNSDRSRFNALLQLMEKHPRIVVFYNFNYELDILREIYDIPGIEVGEWNGHKKTPIPDSEKWVYLVQYVAGAEGWNCTETDTIVMWSLTYSYKNHEQCMGRIDRLDTPFVDLWYYIFVTNSVISLAVLKSLDSKQHFNEKKFLLTGVFGGVF